MLLQRSATRPVARSAAARPAKGERRMTRMARKRAWLWTSSSLTFSYDCDQIPGQSFDGAH